MSDHQTVRAALEELAGNFAFSWHPSARGLFERLDPETWERVEHNPRALVAELPDEVLARAADDPGFRVALEEARAEVRAELERETWWERHGHDRDFLVAYFSTEFGLDESLPIYSGGLGVLAGDHLKSSSDLGVPLVAVGLLYREGYFRQGLDESGWQVERYPTNDPARLALTLEDARRSRVASRRRGRSRVRIWRADAGRTRLYLLDTDVEGNSDRGPRRHLDALRRRPRAAAAAGARARHRRRARAAGARPRADGLPHERGPLRVPRPRACARAARRRPSAATRRSSRSGATTVFTTHTPVPAGNEVFDPELVRRYLGAAGRALRRSSWDDLLAARARARRRARLRHDPARPAHLGRSRTASRRCTARSRARCGPTSGRARPTPTCRSARSRTASTARPGSAPSSRTLLRDARRAHRRRSGRATAGARRAVSPTRSSGSAHARRKRALVDVARRRFERQLGGGSGGLCALDPDALTIGFARRFATYKRATLLFADSPAAGLAPQRAVAAGAARRRRQGAPRRRRRQGADPADRRALPRPALRRARRLPRGLRHGARARARAGRRRLAQHAAPAAGGVGHERHEGGDERRAQRLDPRRLVGRGLRPGARLGDRRDARSTPTRPSSDAADAAALYSACSSTR